MVGFPWYGQGGFTNERLSHLANDICDRFQREFMKNCQFKNIPVGLMTGKAGYVLYLLHKYEVTFDGYFLKQARKALESLIVDIQGNSSEIGLSYAEGLTGIATTFDILIANDAFEFEYDILKMWDEKIYNWTLEQSIRGNMDFFYGSSGGIFHLLNRAKKNQNLIPKIQQILDAWSSAAVHQGDSVTFLAKKSGFKNDVILTGLAHGMCSVLLLYCKAYLAGLDQNRCLMMIEQIVNFYRGLLRKQESEDSPAYFPQSVTHIATGGNPSYKPKLAWCNGDLSIAYALMVAGRIIGGDTYQLGVDVANNACQREAYSSTKIDSIHMCHGTSGVYATLKAVARMENSERLHLAAARWSNITSAGITSRDPYVSPAFDLCYSLLNGVCGAEITLAAGGIWNHAINELFLLNIGYEPQFGIK